MKNTMPLLKSAFVLSVFLLSTSQSSCAEPLREASLAEPAQATQPSTPRAKDILGNPDYPAFSYGGYREATRDAVPTVDQLKEDMCILSAMGVKLLRTYNTQQYGQAANLVEAIHQLRQEDPGFEMYVMLGAWIDCEGAWTDTPNHEAEDVENNTAEINAAVELANAYPDTVKIIAVGNEAMVHWASAYFVRPGVILHWVNHLQALKASGDLPADIWVTSSDSFSAWGGEAPIYRTETLEALIKAVDFVSMHTYPFHDTHHNPEFWGASEDQAGLSAAARADAAMQRARGYAVAQYQSTADYIHSLDPDKPIHIGETGWASFTDTTYGGSGSRAADEYKSKLYYEAMRDWTNAAGLSCFYFEAFDEKWKDQDNPLGSENYFGLINLKGQAKYALWDLVDAGVFEGLNRGGVPITKTYGGDEAAILADLLPVPRLTEIGNLAITATNDQREPGEAVTEGRYVVLHPEVVPEAAYEMTYPSAPLKLNVWEGTCAMGLTPGGVIEVATGTGDWWGCALEIQAGGQGENLSEYKSGRLHFEIKGDTATTFSLGFQTGQFAAGTQTNNEVAFGPDGAYPLTDAWAPYSIAVSELNSGADLTDVTGILFLRGGRSVDGKTIQIRNVYYTRD